VPCSSLGLLASSSKKFGRLSAYAERIVEAEDAVKQIALDTSGELCYPHPKVLNIKCTDRTVRREGFVPHWPADVNIVTCTND